MTTETVEHPAAVTTPSYNEEFLALFATLGDAIQKAERIVEVRRRDASTHSYTVVKKGPDGKRDGRAMTDAVNEFNSASGQVKVLASEAISELYEIRGRLADYLNIKDNGAQWDQASGFRAEG